MHPRCLRDDVFHRAPGPVWIHFLILLGLLYASHPGICQDRSIIDLFQRDLFPVVVLDHKLATDKLVHVQSASV